ncbi:hypothetical protein [Kangiella sp.]|uniref:hypothetical protein n=1 Tax=Kangiella sp. TaxID=1920245 RepID=UPI003A8F59FF
MISNKLKLPKVTFILVSVLGLSINVPTKAGHFTSPNYGECYHYHVNKWGFKVLDSYLGPKNAFYSCAQLYYTQVMQEHQDGMVMSNTGQEAYHSEFQEHLKDRPDDPNCVIDTYDPMEPNL